MNQHAPLQSNVAPQAPQPVPGAQPVAPHQVGAQPPQQPQSPRSGMAVAGLVLGIVALALSWMPIVNNLAFIVALVGLVLGIIGIVGCGRKGKRGKGMAIAGVVLSVVACIVVLGTQAAYTAAIDEAMQGAQVESTSSAGTSASSSASNASDSAQASDELTVGQSATLSNDLVVSVDAVQTGLSRYDGSPATGITVTYVNNGSKDATFNPYDWKGQDANGAQSSSTFLNATTDDSLKSGSLAPGGTVTGNLYFEGDVKKVLYYSNMFSSSPTATWAL